MASEKPDVGENIDMLVYCLKELAGDVEKQHRIDLVRAAMVATVIVADAAGFELSHGKTIHRS